MIRTTLTLGAAQSREIAVNALDRYLAMSAAPVRDSAETVVGVAVIFHDITRLKKLEEVRREFVANVSHELRTPLSIFQGYLEMLQENPNLPRPELVESLRVLRKHSQRLNTLVEDLLTLARLESRGNSLELAPVRLEEFLRAMEQDWKLKFSAKEVRFRLDLEPNLPEMTADSFRLEQVMHNLLENALKYTPAQGEVAVIAKQSSRLDGPDGARGDRVARRRHRQRHSGQPICRIFFSASIGRTKRAAAPLAAPAWGFPSSNTSSSSTMGAFMRKVLTERELPW